MYLANTKRFSARKPYEREKLRIKCLQVGFNNNLSQTLDTIEDQISLHVFDEVSVSKTKNVRVKNKVQIFFQYEY